MKIDYVSPLPPVRSGIADYSLDLLPHLARRCDLRCVRLPGQDVDPALARRFPLVGAEHLGEDGRLPVYQMGNNPHHTSVYELACKLPGVLVLHDLVLHHLLIERTLKGDDFEGYRRELEAEHGWIGDAAARPRRWPGGWADAAQFALPAHRQLVAGQRGVVVHSEWAAATLCEEVPGTEVRVVPMGIPLPPASDPEAGGGFRRRHGIPGDVPLLGSFGFQTPIKRTEMVIAALSRRELHGVHLMVAGEPAAACDYEGAAKRAGVEDRVHLLGFLPFEDFEAGIAATDLCLNLRYPTAGETSASLLRILAAGKGAVVSDHAQSAELSDAGVVKVPLGDDEEEVLAQKLATLLSDRGRLRALGEEARRYVGEHHAPGRAAKALVEACRELAEHEPVALAVDFPRPTSIAWGQMNGELDVEGAEASWQEGERRRLTVRLKNTSAARWLAAERGAGGVALEVQLLGERAEPPDDWLGLPFDLEPGEEHVFELEVRRPLGEVRLRLEPHVFGDRGFSQLEGPVWESEI